MLRGSRIALSALPIDHAVAPVGFRGGATAAEAALATFIGHRLPRYRTDRNNPDDDVSSGLSPYLHFGHIGAHEVFDAVMTHERWSTRAIAPKATGSRDGWWGASPSAESFLDEFVTWRELGFNACVHREDHASYEALPAWARATLDRHAGDPRAYAYSLEDLTHARTHDAVWNAAQRQLTREGRLHNYLRMLWGKKILEWTRSPREALDTMVELNNKYAIDGRDPNSYTGILWVLGRYDRPWAPERPVFGSVRYMSSENTVRKLRMKAYLRKYGS
jgi:deoxyribodipyrimidine photo-lyase